MSDERRFDDDEVAEILTQATSAPSRSPVTVSDTGVTLAELREIGAEVGIDPARIDSAARDLVTGGSSLAPASSFLGAARSLQRTLRIKRAPTDEEWRRIVTELRATFGGRGVEATDGASRSWAHGDVQLVFEPDVDGGEIAMGASNGNVSRITTISTLTAAAAVVFIALMLVGPFNAEVNRLLALLTFLSGSISIGATAVVRAQLPGWADKREVQMDLLEDRILKLIDD